MRSSGTDADESLPAGPELASQVTLLGDLNALRSQLRRVVQHVSRGSHWYDDPAGAGESGSSIITVVAGEIISPLQVVRPERDGSVVLARPPETEALVPLGVTIQSANAPGALLDVATAGLVVDPFWNWIVGQAVMLGPNGTLTQAPPSDLPFLVTIGFATATDTLVVQIGQPIRLAG